MATRPIQAFRLQTRLEVDGSQHTSNFKKAEGEVKKYGDQVIRTGKDATNAFKGAEVGKKWGTDFGTSAVASITGSIGSIGQTIGALIGTGLAPGIGTAIGSTIGSGIDTALQKVSGPILEQITRGIELNKLLKKSKLHFTTFIGDEKEAVAHLEELKKLSGDTGLRMGVLVEGSHRLEEFTNKLDLSRLIMRAAADQSARFHGDATEGFDEVADALGRIVLRGEDVGKLLKKLEGQGIHWKQYLAEGLGLSEKQVTALLKGNRLRGEGVATLVAQGIERHAGGFAQMMGPASARADALMEIRAAEGTQRLTGGISDAYRQFAELLASPESKKVVDFIDKMGGYVVDFTEGAVKKAVSVGGGIAEGLMNFSPSQMMGSFSKLGDFVESGLKSVFEIHSPSERSAREIGEPMGEGLGVGMARRFKEYLQGPGKDEIVQTLEELLKQPQIRAFLDLIGKSEVGSDPNKYSRLFGPLGHAGDPSQLSAANPNWRGMRVKSPTLGRMVMTHPLGPYQIEPANAKRFSQLTGAQSMDPHTQDLIAVWLMTQTRGAIQNILSGNAPGAMKALGGTWESFRVNGSNKSSGLVSQFNAAVSGAPVSASNPMPVRITTGEGKYLDDLLGLAQRQMREMGPPNDGAAARPFAGALFDWAGQQKDLSVTLGIEDAAVVNVTEAHKELITTTSLTADQISGMGITLHKLISPIVDVSESAQAAYAINADLQKKNRDLYIENLSLGEQIVGAFQQISGMVPSQQVGKKRGFFSKLLGFAAPFLSFIPGVGPILSTIAGAASSIVGGNYGAGVSTIAGGFASGGVFRGAPSTSGGGKSSGHGRAFGGPALRGQPYIVGDRWDHQPELFVPDQNGYIYPPGHGAGGQGGAVFERLHALLARLESMPADHVVRMGARGLFTAMDNDASLRDGYGRRLGLA